MILNFIFNLFICISNEVSSDYSYLNSSGTKYDPVRDIIENNNDINNNNENPQGNFESSNDSNEKDTDRLYSYLKPGEGRRIEDTQLFKRANVADPSYKNKMRKLLGKVREDHPNFFTPGEQRGHNREFGHIRLRSDLLENIKKLKKDYPEIWRE